MSHITRKKDLKKTLTFKLFFILVMFLFFVFIITAIVFSTDEAIAKNNKFAIDNNIQFEHQKKICNNNCFNQYNYCQNEQKTFCSKKLDSCLDNCYD